MKRKLSKTRLPLFAASVGLLCSVATTSLYATEAVIKWKDFDRYTDVAPANHNKKAFHKNIEKHFNDHIEKLARKLPDGYTLTITVNDLDLAGDVRIGINEVRIIKPIYFPKIKFDYIVTASDAAVVSKGSANLKDMGFMTSPRLRSNDTFYYDKKLIEEWFKDELLPKVKA
ncbi:DUF3016 domain-containing protein [Flocculibacter collagenilyticus]|uniref:DUF3016 domain-containing protein n=1 Tax=Flocculibacter collagenilyticus TaxID=2744479 RepID=UPI0018F6D000|nr:DUF3016 domain-containing protein [Flocculibacter collagenilyticus]